MVLALSCFGKGNNKTGIYPSCKECEREQKAMHLLINPLCCRCKVANHMEGDSYCYPCSRVSKGRGERRWISRRTGLEWCKICEQSPRLSYHQYCGACKREYDAKNRKERHARKGISSVRKYKNTVRGYATGLLNRGKIKRGPCVFCGEPGVDFHHYDYLPRTRNFDDVCEKCHVEAHQLIKTLLTLSRNGVIRLTVD